MTTQGFYSKQVLLLIIIIYIFIIIIIIIVIITALQTFGGPWPLFQFLNRIHSGMTPWTGDQPFTIPLPTHRKTQTQNKPNKRTQISIPRVRFEPMIPMSEPAKTVHALDRAATMIGIFYSY
jgi:hypothetical protein